MVTKGSDIQLGCDKSVHVQPCQKHQHTQTNETSLPVVLQNMKRDK